MNENLKKYFQKDVEKNLNFYKKEDSAIIEKNINKREMWNVYKKILKRIVENYEVSTAIDIGCGMGNFTFELNKIKKLKRVIGVDFLRETFSIALEKQELFDKTDFIQGNMLDLCFKKKSFDIVFCLNLLHHFEGGKFYKSLFELANICKKILVLEIRNKDYIFDYFYNHFLIPYIYKDLAVYSRKIYIVENYLNSKDFKLEFMLGKRNNNLLCRRTILVFKREKK